ncbi:MAG: family 10 glycosylhydrolase, partial [Snowella sp.]
MKFRSLTLFFASFLCIVLVSHPLTTVFSQPTQEIRGVWLTTNDTNTLIDSPQLQEAIAQLASLNFNTLYPVVWNSGYALYPSTVAKEAGIQPFVHKGLQGQDILADLIEGAHRQGLLVIPWFEFGLMAPPTSELALNHPKWLTQRQDGTQEVTSAAGEVVWLNPFHPEVQQFIISLVMEVMDSDNVDGIQFDDHLSLPVELGYDSYTINLYKQETKKDPPTNPRDRDWMRWRADKLTAFVWQLNQAIKWKKANAILSISPNPYETAYNSYLQDWLDWVRNDLVDELVIQVYRSDLSAFTNQLNR